MAGAKINAKAKLKDDKAKFLNSNGCGDEPDSALLRKPIQTSITGFAQARKIFDNATEELKGLLTTECDLLYECKVCRNLFRSLANFISHKRVYCKETFNSSVHGHFIKPTSTDSEMSKIKQLEEGYQEFLRTKSAQEPPAPLERIPLSKDLTEVVENLMKNKDATVSNEGSVLEVALQVIPSSAAAVFQNLVTNDDSGDDMCDEVTEIDGMTAKDIAVLKEDGKFEVRADVPDKQEAEQVISISDDDESNQLNCKICDIQFSTRKTLKFHMKYKHVPDRLVYPCTDCCDIFATCWSVLRHLYRVHRKTLTQIRRMREMVQSRAFRMNNMPTSYVKRNNKKVIIEQKLTEEERMDQENQAWMDNMESDSELPRCGGCGRSFERRAALAAHTYTCQSRTRALARKPALSDKRADRHDDKVQAKKDKPKSQASPNDGDAKLTIKQMKSSILDKEMKGKDSENDNDEEMEVEIDDAAAEEDSKTNDESDSESDSKSVTLNFPQATERENMEALKKVMAEFVDGGACKLCKRKYSSHSHLCRHMSSHLNWRRYGCKLCSYVNYDKNRLVMHAQNIHKLKGSDEFYSSILRVLPASEAIALSTTLVRVDEEWVDSREEVESLDSSESARSSDNESESSNSRTEPIKQNRRKQTFKSIRIVKTKSTSPGKDEEKQEKAGTKRPSNIPIDKVIQVVLGNNELDKSKPKDQVKKESPDKAEQAESASRRPIRKRMRPKKDEDFEYDFTNVMKWESNSYKETESKATGNSRVITSKRKSQAETSPTESSPEKTDKDKTSDKQEKSKEKEEKPPKQVKTEEKKKSYSGSLAVMSDASVSLSQAHLRPSSASRLPFIVQNVPFDVRTHFRNIQASKLVLSSQDITSQRKIDTTYLKSQNASITEKSKSENADNEIDIEKQIDEANARNKVTTAVKATVLQQEKPIIEAKYKQKPGTATTNQKWIVMKRIKSKEDSSQSSGKIQFPSIMSLERSVLKPAIGIKIPKLASTSTEIENKNKPSESQVEPKTDNAQVIGHTKKETTTENVSLNVSSDSNKSDEPPETNNDKT